MRTADGLGLETVYLSGYTPYPKAKTDNRLPYMAEKIDRQIVKTALGAENMVHWEHVDDIGNLIADLKHLGYQIVAVEQTAAAQDLLEYQPTAQVALIVGREVDGIEGEVLEMADKVVSIPMLGQKESFNVVQAAAMALFLATVSLKDKLI